MANGALTFEPFVDAAGEHRYRCVHSNGNTIFGPEEGYKNYTDMIEVLENALEAIKEGRYVILSEDEVAHAEEQIAHDHEELADGQQET